MAVSETRDSDLSAPIMQENDVQEPALEGINILKDGEGNIYVVNEILSFYQRKLRVLGHQATLILSHHVFGHEKLNLAKLQLKRLWEWRKCEPCTPNDYIIKNLSVRRNQRNKKTRIAEDIIHFFNVEDRNLNIVFLTLKVEEIPSNIHEKEAMKDIYVLLDKSQQDYSNAMELMSQKNEQVDNLSGMVSDLQHEVKQGFLVMFNILRNSQRGNENSNIISTTPAVQSVSDPNVSADNEIGGIWHG